MKASQTLDLFLTFSRSSCKGHRSPQLICKLNVHTCQSLVIGDHRASCNTSLTLAVA